METNNLTAPIAVEKDRNTLTIELMNRMKLHGMAAAFTESLTSTMAETMTIDSFLHMLLAREWDYRANAAIQRLIRGAAFRYKACLEQIDYAIPRGLDRNQMERLASLVHPQGTEPLHHRVIRYREELPCHSNGV